MVLDSIRTIVIWVVSLALAWQPFEGLQIFGFLLLIIGMMLYNDVGIDFIKKQFLRIVLRRGQPQPAPAPLAEDEEPLLRGSKYTIEILKLLFHWMDIMFGGLSMTMIVFCFKYHSTYNSKSHATC